MRFRWVLVLVACAALVQISQVGQAGASARSEMPVALAEGDDDEDNHESSSLSTRASIIAGGVFIAVGLGVQQARSRLQTKDPDTL